MTLFADEGVDFPLVQALRKRGFQVMHALETMQGADDETILAEADANNAVLLTKDKDFGEMVIRRTLQCKGVVLIRVDDLSDAANIEVVNEALSRHIDELQEHFTVIQKDKIRIRKLE